MKIPILAAITIMSTLLAVPLGANFARAVPGLSVTNPANIWSPQGPYAATPATTLHHVVLKYYSGDPAEYGAFKAGGPNGLDIGDSGTAGTGPPPADWPNYDATTSPGVDWNMTIVQPSGDWQGIYFNGASSTWALWGCDWQFYNSACGIEMRQAFAHLINRPDFVTANDLGGVGANAIWDDAPGNKVLSSDFSPSNPGGCPTLPSGSPAVSCTFSSPSSNFCSWDTIDNTGCTKTIGPYVVGGTGATLGFPAIPNGAIASCPAATSPVTNPAAWSGCTNDFAVAAAHMVRAGVASAMSQDGHYQIGAFLTNPTNVANNPFRAFVRSTAPRRAMGDGFVAGLNNIFGTGGAAGNVVAVQHCGIVVCGFNHAFSEPPFSPVDDWDSLTYGYADGSPFPVYLFTQFSSLFTYDNPALDGGNTRCGGVQTSIRTADFPTNPTFVCIDGRLGNPSADTALLQAASNDNLVETTFDNKMALSPGSALDILGRDVASIPVHTLNVRTPSLRAVSGLTNTKGLGFGNVAIFSLAHKGTYTPVDPKFAFDAALSPDTVRWGQAQPIDFVNPYQAGSVWEFQTLGLVYDVLFTVNPIRPQEVFCEMCQTYSTDTTTANTKITVELRQNLEFQDGTPVTAKDVAFSYLTLRDFASVLSGPLGLLQSVTLNPTDPLQIIIQMQGHSVGHLPNLAGVTILPMSRWACAATPCGSSAFSSPNQYNVGLGGTTFPGVDANKASAGYDPVLDNNFLGSGLFMCTDNAGTVIGGGCTFNSLGQPIGQSVDVGGSTRLSLFDRTSGPAALNDPFAQYTRLNNPAWGTGSGAAAQSGQFQEFLYSQRGATQQVSFSDAQEITNNCFGATSATSSQGGLTCPDYTYWVGTGNVHGNAFNPSQPGRISEVYVDIVLSHYLDGGVLPFSWTGAPPQVGVGTLDNIIPFTQHCPPYGTGTPPNCF